MRGMAHTWNGSFLAVVVCALALVQGRGETEFSTCAVGPDDAQTDECAVPVEFAEEVREIYSASLLNDAEDFDKNENNMGPMHLWCERVKPNGESETLAKMALGDWPKGGENVGLALRSLSKLYVSIAVLALMRRPEGAKLSLDTRVGDIVDICTDFRDASIRQLLALNVSGFDNRYAVLANRDKKPGSNVDHVGWPPKCDVDGLSVAQCVEQYVCPMYDDTAVTEDLDKSTPDITCKDKFPKCWEAASKGQCFNQARPMLSLCPVACGQYCCDIADFADMCMVIAMDKKLCETMKDKQGKLYATYACRKTCGTCSPDKDIEAYGYHLTYDEEAEKVEKKQRRDCVYENYAYTLLDYIVQKASGKDLAFWVEETLLRPLNMQTSLYCMGYQSSYEGEEPPACYEPPLTVEDHVDSSKWPQQSERKLHSQNWISNAFISSPKDLMAVSLMLMNNGTWNGQHILEQEDVDAIFTPWNTFNRAGNCMGTQGFGFGVGYCSFPEPTVDEIIDEIKKYRRAPRTTTSLCTSKDFWTWAGSYGSRFIFLRDYAVACLAMGNQNTIKSKSTNNRISSRSHLIGHKLAKLLRSYFPAYSSIDV